MRKSLLVLVSVFLAAPVLAAEPEFSADMNMTAAGQDIQSKVYYSQKKVRFDMLQAVSITRLDENVTYILLPSQKTYMRQQIDPESMAKVGAVSGGETERVSMGKEKVNGIDTEKFKVSYSGKQGAVSAYQWLTKDQFPVKVEAIDGSWSVVYSNLVPGPQPASLFEVPADYEQFQMPALGGVQGLLSGAGGSVPNMGGMTGAQGIDMDSLEKMADQLKDQMGSASEE
jgi:hypothetical protein